MIKIKRKKKVILYLQKSKRLSEGEAQAVPHLAAYGKLRQDKGGQGTIGSLRRFFSSFLSAVGKKRGRRRQDKPSARQGVRKRQRGADAVSLPQSKPSVLPAPSSEGALEVRRTAKDNPFYEP